VIKTILKRENEKKEKEKTIKEKKSIKEKRRDYKGKTEKR